MLSNSFSFFFFVFCFLVTFPPPLSPTELDLHLAVSVVVCWSDEAMISRHGTLNVNVGHGGWMIGCPLYGILSSSAYTCRILEPSRRSCQTTLDSRWGVRTYWMADFHQYVRTWSLVSVKMGSWDDLNGRAHHFENEWPTVHGSSSAQGLRGVLGS